MDFIFRKTAEGQIDDPRRRVSAIASIDQSQPVMIVSGHGGQWFEDSSVVL